MRAMLLPPPPPPRSCRAALAVLLMFAAVLLVAAQGDWAAEDDAADYGYGVACTGAVGECAVARRELGGGGYIGYNVLQKDRTPCSYRGASYYNCQPSGAANPYSRGCSAIAQCRG